MPVPTTHRPTHHWLKRRAEAVADRWNGKHPSDAYRAVVVKVQRGPRGRWRVELERRPNPLD